MAFDSSSPLELLQRPALGRLEREVLDRVLSFPWCYPADPDLRAHAERHGFSSPGDPAPGASLLVAVRDLRAGDGELLLLAAGRPRGLSSDEPTRPLGVVANEALSRAVRLGLRHLPLASPDRAAASARSLAVWHLRSGSGRLSPVLDGGSFGLGFLLGVTSLFAGLPLSPRVCALATVDAEGRLGSVNGLAAKLSWLAHAALGVERVVVASGVLDHGRALARDLAETTGRALDVVCLGDEVAPVLRELLPGLDQSPALAGWSGREHLPQALAAADELFKTALDGSPVLLDWRGISVAAERARRFLDSRGETRGAARAGIAERIARRHLGDQALLSWPPADELAALPRPLRLKLLAHVVQSAADAPSAEGQDYVARATPFLASPQERHGSDLRLLGAMGRALAAADDLEGASRCLEEAIHGWFALLRVAEASHALSEYLRVLGLRRDGPRLDDLLERVFGRFAGDPAVTSVSLAFTRLATGRALLLCDRPAVGRDYLEALLGPGASERLPDHLVHSARRWLARALDAVGASAEAAALREALVHDLAACGDPQDACFGLLAQLDAALATGADPAPHLEALLASTEGPEIRRLLGRPDASPSERARRVADGFRY